MPKKVEISHRTIIFTVFFILLLWLLFQIRQIILALFVSLILMSALNPAVDRLERLRIPRALAILLLYLVIFGVIGIILAGLIPPLVDQTSTLISRLPSYLEGLGLPAIDEDIIASQISQLGSIPANLLRFTVTIFSNLVAVFALAVITFYLLLERKNLDRYLFILFGERDVEIIPNIGPIVSAIPAVLTGLTISPLLALAVAALYFLIQQLENTVIVPKVMEKVVGINPLVTILSLAIGFKLAGIVGAVLAVPVVLVSQVVASEVFSSRHFQEL